jgi:exopolysaccharide production protein ExoZ
MSMTTAQARSRTEITVRGSGEPQKMHPSNGTAAPKLDAIQALRAIPASAAVLVHINVFHVLGTWGIDLFFAISGFIMCYVTARSDPNFFLKRMIRIAPLYWLGTLAVFAIALVMPALLNSSKANLAQVVKSLAFIPYEKSPGVTQPLLFLGWTLEYEMLFYVIFAACLALNHRLRGWICSAVLLSIALVGYLVDFKAVPLHFWTSSIVIEFVPGIVAYGLWTLVRDRQPGRGARIGLTLAGIAALVLMNETAPLVVKYGQEWRFLISGLPALACFLFLTLAWTGLRLPRLVTLTGDASYSLYLFHPYLVVVAAKALHLHARPAPVSWALGVLIFAACIGAAIPCYRWIERPMTDGLRRRLVKRRA